MTGVGGVDSGQLARSERATAKLGSGWHRDDGHDVWVDAAVELAPALARHVLARTAFSLLQRAAQLRDPEQLKVLLEAERSLHRNLQEVAAAFAPALRRELLAAPTCGEASGFGWELLGLIGTEELDERVALDRSRERVESALAPLVDKGHPAGADGSVATPAEPPRHVAAGAWLRALHGAMAQRGIPRAVRMVWLEHCHEHLAIELAACSTRLAGLWRRYGTGADSHLPGSPSSAPAASALGSDEGLELSGLRRLLAGGGATPRAHARAAAIGDPAPFGAAAEQVALRERLMDKALSTLACDERLAPAARELMRSLRPHYMAVASGDVGFFTDRLHPAREFLAELAQCCVLWPAREPRGLRQFLEPLVASVAALREQPAGSVEAASLALARLRDSCRASDIPRRHDGAIVALQRAEYRNVMAAAIAVELRVAPGFGAAPEAVRQFLQGPWSQVMACAALEDIGAPDPGSHGRTAADLIWCAKTGAADEDPQRMAAAISRVFTNLKRGLARIKWPEHDTAAFLNWLSPLMRDGGGRLDASRGKAAGTAPSSVWLAEREARRGRLLRGAALLEAFPQIAGELPRAEVPTRQVPGALVRGATVEVHRADRWQRWQVAWASRHGLLFLFGDAAGRIRSLEAQTLAALLRCGAIRIVSPRALLDTVLDGVAQVALRNSAARDVPARSAHGDST